MSGEMIQHYRQLAVWQKSMDFADAVYDACSSFPKEELYGLTSQLKRSAISVPSNIAEGAARQGTGEFLQFLSIAKGSLAELETQVILAQRRQFLSKEDMENLLEQADEISRMLSGLQRSLKTKRAA
ncbi:MAG: four helix bundle protein [Rickettsiales bacterium]